MKEKARIIFGIGAALSMVLILAVLVVSFITFCLGDLEFSAKFHTRAVIGVLIGTFFFMGIGWAIFDVTIRGEWKHFSLNGMLDF